MSIARQRLPDFTQVLFEDAYQGLALGLFPMQNSPLGEYHALPLPGDPGRWRVPVNHWSWSKEGRCFQIVEHEGARVVETIGSSPHYDNRILIAGEAAWSDYRVRTVVTPLSFEGASPAGGLCGLIARYEDSRTYLALVLDRDGALKLLRRRENIFDVLASAPLPFEPGRPLSFSLAAVGNTLAGEAGGVSLVAKFDGYARGKIGLIADVPARFGPVCVDAPTKETERLAKEGARAAAAFAKRVKKYPAMRLEREVKLGGLVNGRSLRIADVNGDGKLEIVLAQGSKDVAAKAGLTRLTCLSVLDLDGKVLWQEGTPDPAAEIANGDMPFQVADVNGDGKPEVICVFGYELQVRDAATGKLLMKCPTPETEKVGADFMEVSASWGSPWGDETPRMNVAQFALCNTLGRTDAREILVKDDYHHLAVISFADGSARTVFKHRGVHGHFPWCGDLDGDGRDEIFAGYSLLDHDGKKIWSLHLQDHQDAIAVLDPAAPGGKNKRIFMCGGEDGMLVLGLKAEFHTRVQGHCQRMGIAKFRADLPGLQIATVTFWGNPGIFRLHDATGKLLWSKEWPVCGGLAAPVNWSGRAEELMLYSMEPGAGLLDGHGELCVEAPREGPHACFDVSDAFMKDGRDSLLAWDRERLRVYVPSDAPLKGARAKAVYRPKRSYASGRSNYQAYVSLPPGW